MKRLLGTLGPGESRMVLISDGHTYESSDPLKRELPGKSTAGEKIIAKGVRSGEDKLRLVLDEAGKIDSVNSVFFGGDMVTGFGERGLIGPDSQRHIDQFKGLLEGRIPGLPRRFMAGGHELGYVLPLSTDPEGGISEESVSVFERNFGPIFYSFFEGPYKCIVLSSDLDFFQEGPEAMMARKRQQQEFYQDEIASADCKVVIMIHDPDALAAMFPFLEGQLGKIAKVFSGHQHARWTNRIYPWLCKTAASRLLELPLKPAFNRFFPGKADAVWKYFRDNKGNARIWKQLNLSIIPAPGGMLGIGGGFLVADFREGSIEVVKIRA